MDVKIIEELNNITVLIEDYQYDGTIQSDGSVYSTDFEIYYKTVSHYITWCKNDYLGLPVGEWGD
jgi:7-keto-8-aminopelargonate synthetase-like enzyme